MTKNITLKYTQVVLDELDTVVKDPSRWMSTSSDIEVDALQELVGKAVGVKYETETNVNKRGPRMTQQELIAMKQVSTKVEEPIVRFVQKMSKGMAKGWLTVKGWFFHRDAPRKVCQQIGHECLNCGMTVPFKNEE